MAKGASDESKKACPLASLQISGSVFTKDSIVIIYADKLGFERLGRSTSIAKCRTLFVEETGFLPALIPILTSVQDS